MKSKMKFMLLLFVCFFALSFNVKADYQDNTTSAGGTDGTSSGCGGKDSCWYTGYYGLRMSLYKFEESKATETPTDKIGNTVDFIGNDNNGYRSSGQLNRIGILGGSSPSFTTTKGNTASAPWLSNMYKSTGLVPSQVEKHIMGACYKKTVKDYADENTYFKALKECLTPFFQEMGATSELTSFIDGILKGENKYDIFIMYEPMAGINLADQTYAGSYLITGTELAWMYDSSSYKVSYVSTLVRSYWDGGKLAGNHVAATAYQASEKIAGFTPINLATTQLAKNQHNKNRYGVSIGVARLKELIDAPKICVYVEETNKYYGKTANKVVTQAVYESECLSPPPPPEICTFDLIAKIVKDCKDGTEGYVMDIEDWDCIYESRNSTNPTVKDHFYTGVENRYCSIFCRERVYYYYPGSYLTVRSGHHFGVGKTGASNTLLPVNMTGRSECRVNYGTGGGEIGKINYALFKTDWETANKTVLSTWNTMNIQLAYSDSIDKAIESPVANCAYFCDYNLNKECCSSGYWDPYEYECGTEKNPRTCTGYNWVCTSYVSKYYHGKWNTPQTQYYNGVGYTASGWCSHCGHATYAPTTCSSSTSLSTAVSNYNTALRNRNQYLTQLMQCNNFQRTYKDFKPTIQFKYDEGEYEKLNFNYSYSDVLHRELEIRAQTNYFKGVPETGYQTGEHKWNTSTYEKATSDITYVNGVLSNDMLVNNSSIYAHYASGGNKGKLTLTPYKDSSKNNSSYTFGDKTTIAGYDCVTYRSTCNSSITNTTYPTNDAVRMWTTKEFDYELKPGVYNYVRKDTGQSLSTVADKNYYVVGYSNLPTHYSRKTRSDYHFYLDFSPEIFGVNQKFYDFLKLGENTGITYGQEKIVTIYEKLWNNATLNRMINDCCEGGKHLNHSFVSSINAAGISTSDFLETPCAKQFGCYIVSGYKVICPQDNKYSSCSSNNYSQLRACIQSQVVDRVGQPMFTDTDYTYKCTYTIKNEIVSEPDCMETNSCYIGLSAVYRTIDLNDPFPDRGPSGNWTDSDSDRYITSNRNVTANNIYIKKDPMYKITLTPALTSEIRKYNDTHDMLDYNLECNSAGEVCKSNFIRKTFASKFSGCGISGKGSSKCVTGEAW